MSESISTEDCGEDTTCEKKSDFMKIGGNIFSNINYKQTIFMFLMGMVIFSDLFIDGVLTGMSGAVDGECPTTKGTIVQLTVFCLLLIVVDLMIKYSWI
jgi:hypothetical protein